jgi:hypothetical protein
MPRDYTVVLADQDGIPLTAAGLAELRRRINAGYAWMLGITREAGYVTDTNTDRRSA